MQIRGGIQTRFRPSRKQNVRIRATAQQTSMTSACFLLVNPTQLAIIMQLCEYWWDKERKPYPSKKVLAERLGIGPRQLQRHLAELEKAELIRRVERRNRAASTLQLPKWSLDCPSVSGSRCSVTGAESRS